jgi:hypothetical protein
MKMASNSTDQLLWGVLAWLQVQFKFEQAIRVRAGPTSCGSTYPGRVRRGSRPFPVYMTHATLAIRKTSGYHPA